MARNAGVNQETGQSIPHVPTDASRAEVLALAKRGATVEEIAVIMNIRPGHVRMHYGAMVDRELALHTLEVEEAMLLTAKGRFTHPDTHIAVVATGRNKDDIKVVKTPLIKHYPPNVAAQQFWTKNRQPGHRTPGPWEDQSESTAPPPDEGAAAIRARLKDMDKAGG